MRRLSISNTVFVFVFVVFFPVYPVFGGVLYNISGGIQNFSIDTASIINEEFAQDDNEFISPDIPLEAEHNWGDRKESITYIVQDGDTISQLAYDFGIDRSTIRWVNSLPSNTLRTGQKLIIPPGDGFVYSVIAGDTLESIAQKYATTTLHILEKNPHISDGVDVNDLIYFPHLQPPRSASLVSDTQDEQISSYSSHTLRLLNSGGKGFVPGHCTYFVAKYWDVQWRGHAKDWYKNAQKAGYKTGKVAVPGAIVVWYGPGYNLAYGHVGIVMSVNQKKGTMVVKDMNYTGLWKITTRTEKLNNKYIIGFIYNQKK